MITKRVLRDNGHIQSVKKPVAHQVLAWHLSTNSLPRWHTSSSSSSSRCLVRLRTRAIDAYLYARLVPANMNYYADLISRHTTAGRSLSLPEIILDWVRSRDGRRLFTQKNNEHKSESKNQTAPIAKRAAPAASTPCRESQSTVLSVMFPDLPNTDPGRLLMLPESTFNLRLAPLSSRSRTIASFPS